MSSSLFISHIAYTTGEPFPINTIEGPFEDTINILESTGLSNYCKSKVPLVDMAYDCVSHTLENSDYDPKQLGNVICSQKSDTSINCY